MASIVETIVGDRRIVLGNEEFVRQMSIGINWTKIRIGMSMALNGNASITTASLLLGICEGTADTFSSASCTDWVGCQIGFGYQCTYTYVAGPPAYYQPAQGATFIKKVNATTTTTGNSNVTGSITATSASVRSAMYLDIVKTAPNLTFTIWGNVSVPIDTTSGAFLYSMDAETAPLYCQSNLTTVNTIAYSGNYAWDTVSIVWNKSTPTVEISSVAVVRYY